MEQLVRQTVQVGNVLGFTVGGFGVGAAGHGAAHANHDLLTLDLGHRNDVDALQEVGAFGDLVVQFLGNGRLDVELASHVDTVGLGDGLTQGRVLLQGAVG
ncbi:hypothetical protein D3C76_1593080 [compost metagenome]